MTISEDGKAAAPAGAAKGKEAGVSKASKAQRMMSKGKHTQRQRKVRYTPRFFRPKTFRPPREPKYSRRSVPHRNTLDAFKIIRYPLTTESSMKKIEDNNTLVFIVDKRANKPLIKASIKRLYDIDSAKINTLIR